MTNDPKQGPSALATTAWTVQHIPPALARATADAVGQRVGGRPPLRVVTDTAAGAAGIVKRSIAKHI